MIIFIKNTKPTRLLLDEGFTDFEQDFLFKIEVDGERVFCDNWFVCYVPSQREEVQHQRIESPDYQTAFSQVKEIVDRFDEKEIDVLLFSDKEVKNLGTEKFLAIFTKWKERNV